MTCEEIENKNEAIKKERAQRKAQAKKTKIEIIDVSDDKTLFSID